jgi:hypothetical protein
MPIIFSLAKNENAQNYFDSGSSEKIIQYEKLIPVVTEKYWISIPIQKGIPTLVKTKSMNKSIINKVRILNHRWIIADFSDGEVWEKFIEIFCQY